MRNLQSRGVIMGAVETYPVRLKLAETDAGGETARHGGCSCGAVRFKVRGEPIKVSTCHCTECRKATGAAFTAYADWRNEAFSYSGSLSTYHGRSFCPVCGSQVFHLSPEGVEVMIGALDDVPSGLAPTREGWITRREAWQAPVHGAGQFEHDPI